jgi:hypothetical protein
MVVVEELDMFELRKDLRDIVALDLSIDLSLEN